MTRTAKTIAAIALTTFVVLVYVGITEEVRERDACKGKWDSSADDGMGACVVTIGGAQ